MLDAIFFCRRGDHAWRFIVGIEEKTSNSAMPSFEEGRRADLPMQRYRKRRRGGEVRYSLTGSDSPQLFVKGC